MNATGARRQFASVTNRVARRGARVMVEKSGIPVAGIVSADDLWRLDREREECFSVIDEMRAAFKGVSSEEIEREAERSVAEARTEQQRSDTQG